MDASEDALKLECLEDSKGQGQFQRVRLKVVVDACVKRWFKEYLTAAEEGDPEMQMLVGQMFNTGYGVERDPSKAKYWLDKSRSTFRNKGGQ